jgi:signal transduction histidine kinase
LKIQNNSSELLHTNQVELDEQRFSLILYNIIHNSVKYTRPLDSIIVTAKIVR